MDADAAGDVLAVGGGRDIVAVAQFDQFAASGQPVQRGFEIGARRRLSRAVL